MAAAKRKLANVEVIKIASNHAVTPYEIAHANNNVIAVLRRRASAELGMFAVPGIGGDIYRRRAVIMKVEKATLMKGEVDLEDVPDLEDLHYTDLPWFGHVTLKNAGSRQFRSKNVLAAAVDVVREFDGFLYSLNCDTHLDKTTPNPVLISLTSPSRLETNYAVTVRRNLDAQTILTEFDGVPIVPPTLIKEMTRLGFVQEGNRFTLPGRTDISSRVICTLFGKITTPV